MNISDKFKEARKRYNISFSDIKLGMSKSGSNDPDFGARYSIADNLAVNIKGGKEARHIWNMQRAISMKNYKAE